MAPDSTAIIVSFLSFGVAAISLGWNVYRDVILKPRLKVSVSKSIIVSEFQPKESKFIISAVNHGPGKIRLNIISVKKTSMWERIFRKEQFWTLIHDYRNPNSGQLPISLDVGEKIDLIFPWSSDNALSKEPTHIGISDSFGRVHWSKPKDIKKALVLWQKDFGETPIHKA